MTPVVRRTYAPRGKTPIVEAWYRKGRISAISAVTVSPVRRRPNLFFRLLADDANAHGEDTVAFLAQLRGEIKGPMTILWDQSKIHQRSGVVKAYPAKHPEIVSVLPVAVQKVIRGRLADRVDTGRWRILGDALKARRGEGGSRPLGYRAVDLWR